MKQLFKTETRYQNKMTMKTRYQDESMTFHDWNKNKTRAKTEMRARWKHSFSRQRQEQDKNKNKKLKQEQKILNNWKKQDDHSSNQFLNLYSVID